jgi:hypothetical protein
MKNNQKESIESKVSDKYKEYEELFIKISQIGLNIDDKLKEVQSLIEHVNQRIQYTETRITRTVTFAVTLIVVGMAFFAVSTKLDGAAFYLGICTTLLFILTGGVTALVHAMQVNPKYPFRALLNDWKWFYPKIVDEKYRPTPYVIETENKYWEKRLLHVDGLTKYAEKILNENQNERLKIDIQQLYLLHVNEKYKNAFLSILRRILFLGLLLISISILFLFTVIVLDKIWLA